MSKSLRRKLIIGIAIVVLTVLSFYNESFAAGISASAKNTQLTVGDTTTLTIKANECV